MATTKITITLDPEQYRLLLGELQSHKISLEASRNSEAAPATRSALGRRVIALEKLLKEI